MGRQSLPRTRQAHQIEAALTSNRARLVQVASTLRERIEDGHRSSTEVSARFCEIADRIIDVTARVESIRLATADQDVGVAQSVSAIREMEAATTSNAAVSSEAAALSSELRGRSAALTDVALRLDWVVRARRQSEARERQRSAKPSTLGRQVVPVGA